MKFEQFNQGLFEQISFEDMAAIHGGGGGEVEGVGGGGTTLTCIHTTGSCGCVDADDVD